ncbi:MAG: hypothetical protein H6937_09055 [Burkholderiales bacterium]|nr:hypothetical protein [Burkholderiales bacterium]
MRKILVNKPSGEQAVLTLYDGGAYNDPANVLWDEQTDGPLPAIEIGKMTRVNGQLVTNNGYLPAHLSAVLQVMKSAKVESLKASYEAEIYANIVHAGKTWSADKKAQEILAQVLAVGSVPVGMYWRDVTQTQNPMSYSGLQSFAGAILARGLTADSNLDTKISEVNAATTFAEVDLISW